MQRRKCVHIIPKAGAQRHDAALRCGLTLRERGGIAKRRKHYGFAKKYFNPKGS